MTWHLSQLVAAWLVDARARMQRAGAAREVRVDCMDDLILSTVSFCSFDLSSSERILLRSKVTAPESAVARRNPLAWLPRFVCAGHFDLHVKTRFW